MIIRKKAQMVIGKKVGKKAQLALFVILSIILILIILFLLMPHKDSNSKYDSKTKVFMENFLSCLEGAYEISLESIAYRGGYFDYPDNRPYIDLNYTFIPYYAYEEENYVPSLDEIKNEIVKSAESDIEMYCLSQEFEEVEFSYEDYSLDVEILDNKLIFNLDLDVTVKTGDFTSLVEFKKFPVDINSKLRDMHYVASEISKNDIMNKGWFDVTKLSDISKDTELKIDADEEYDEYPSFVYVIYTEEDNLFPISYQFANKFISSDFSFPESVAA